MELSILELSRNFVPRAAVRKVTAVRLVQVQHDGMAAEHAAHRVHAILAWWSGKEIQQSQSGTLGDKVVACDMPAAIVESLAEAVEPLRSEVAEVLGAASTTAVPASGAGW